MRITLGAIKEILTDYNAKQNRNFVITNEMLHKIKEAFEEVTDYEGTAEDLVAELYEDFLVDCEHEDYSVEEDEEVTGVDIHGDPQYRDYQYKLCNICGATCPILGVEQTGEGEYDEIDGEWEH